MKYLDFPKWNEKTLFEFRVQPEKSGCELKISVSCCKCIHDNTLTEQANIWETKAKTWVTLRNMQDAKQI